MIRRIKPMLARIDKQMDVRRRGYIYEPKFDGIRALCYVEKDTLTFINRNGVVITNKYPEFTFIKNIKATNAILDGEIIVYDKKGNINFNKAQLRDAISQPHLIESRSIEWPATYVVFDVMYSNGSWLIEEPLSERKKVLEHIIKPVSGLLEISPWTHDGLKLWQAVQKIKLEGIMSKRFEGLYYPGKRTSEWLKIKEHQTLDCVIVGFSQERRLVSALALALYKNGELTYISKVGTGFDEATIKKLYAKFKPILRKSPPCPIPFSSNAMKWVRPVLVCEVSYLERTASGSLRVPVFKRLRSDKKARQCTFDQ